MHKILIETPCASKIGHNSITEPFELLHELLLLKFIPAVMDTAQLSRKCLYKYRGTETCEWRTSARSTNNTV